MIELPEIGKEVVITDKINYIRAKIMDDTCPYYWQSGLEVYSFSQYHLWSELPENKPAKIFLKKIDLLLKDRKY
jgi:hypothetical protein